MTYAWSKQTGTGTITFGTATALSTSISADTNGTYTIRLTATDSAGNSAFSDMTLIWDTTLPPTLPSGDIDGDSTVTIADALLALKSYVGLTTLTADQISNDDVSPFVNSKPAPDGTIDLGDVVVILRKSVGVSAVP
jgi:hypothetical protein